MSLRVALQVVGLLVAGYLLFMTLLAMGPIGLVVFVPLLVIGAVQVYRKRTGRTVSDAESPNYCPHCGSAIDVDAVDREETSDDGQWEVRYCRNCGAPLETEAKPDWGNDTTDADPGAAGRTENCPDCGAPNDPHRTECKHCDAEL